jgi:hypothetical protein
MAQGIIGGSYPCLGVPAGVLGKRWLGNGAPRTILLAGAIGQKTRTSGRAGEMTNRKRAHSLRPQDHRVRRRDLFVRFFSGAVALWPLTGIAQERRVPTIGVLAVGSPAVADFWRLFREAMRHLVEFLAYNSLQIDVDAGTTAARLAATRRTSYQSLRKPAERTSEPPSAQMFPASSGSPLLPITGRRSVRTFTRKK